MLYLREKKQLARRQDKMAEEKTEKFEDIYSIVKERNRLANEFNVLKEKYDEDIGKTHLELFGDPRSDEYVSVLKKMKKHANNELKGHPMCWLVPEAEKLMERIRDQYELRDKVYLDIARGTGILLDKMIQLYAEIMKKIDYFDSLQKKKEEKKEEG